MSTVPLANDPQAQGQQKRTLTDRRVMLASLVSVVSLGAMARYSIGPLSPFILADFQLSKVEFGLLSAALSLGGIAAAFGSGILLDRVGVKQMIRLGLLAIGAPLLFFFSPQSFLLSSLLLFLSGVGFSTISPIASNGTMDWFPGRELGFSLGITQAGIPLGIAITAAIMPRLALAVGWQNALGCLGVGIILLGSLSFWIYRDGPLAERRQMQPAASVDKTVSPWSLLQEKNMTWLYLLGLLSAAMQNTLITFLVPFSQDRFSLSVVTAGALLGFSQLAGMVARPAAGLLSDKVFAGRRKPLLGGLALVAGSTVIVLAVMPPALAGWPLMLLISIVGLTTLGWPGLFLTLTIEMARPGLSGAASGLAIAIVMTGSLVGPPLFGYLVDTASYRVGMLLFSLSLIGMATCFLCLFQEKTTSRGTS